MRFKIAPVAHGAIAAALVLGSASVARADPCHLIPDRGPYPPILSRGKVFAGPVVYVGDGDSLCVDVARRVFGGLLSAGGAWAEVRLADFYAPELQEPGGPEAKAALVRIAKGRRVVCVADHRSFDRVVAVCRLGGSSLGDLLRKVGIAEGGRGLRNARPARPTTPRGY